MTNYEEHLRRAIKEGWREPNRVADLEIAAYSAGMTTERNRVLAILSKAVDGSPMRIIDVERLMRKIQHPNDK